MEKRKVELVVLSDIHLGTYGCHAKELVQYLKSIDPKILILNGDIIDIWQFRKRYFPMNHLKVLKEILKVASRGNKVYYITGNHDEFLRKFTDLELDHFSLLNKLVLDLNGEKAWFFHGDVFDASIHSAKFLAKLGGWGYDLLIVINRFTNWILEKLGREKYSLSKRIKQSVKKAISFISDFEETAIELAISNSFDYVVCGHIHHAQIREIDRNGKKCTYLNSGDWVESLSSLEWHENKWSLYSHTASFLMEEEEEEDDSMKDLEKLASFINPFIKSEILSNIETT